MALLEQITEQYATLKTWRRVAENYPVRDDGSQIVTFQTLNRIATSSGSWLPKDKEILTALGLIKPRTQEPQPEWLKRRKKAIRRMVKNMKHPERYEDPDIPDQEKRLIRK